MMDKVLILLLALLFFGISIVIALGRGDWLISGYNTASKTEKAKYNIKRLRLLMSILTAAVGILILVDMILDLRELYFFIIIMWIIIPTMILANTWAKRT